MDAKEEGIADLKNSSILKQAKDEYHEIKQ